MTVPLQFCVMTTTIFKPAEKSEFGEVDGSIAQEKEFAHNLSKRIQTIFGLHLLRREFFREVCGIELWVDIQ